MKLLKTLGILLIIIAVFGALMFALDLYTGPIIEKNHNSVRLGDAAFLHEMPPCGAFDSADGGEL